MSKLEGTNSTGRPCGDARNSTKTDNTGDYSQALEGPGDWQNTEANLGLHHENNCPKESQLVNGQINSSGSWSHYTYTAIVGALVCDLSKHNILHLVILDTKLSKVFFRFRRFTHLEYWKGTIRWGWDLIWIELKAAHIYTWNREKDTKLSIHGWAWFDLLSVRAFVIPIFL